MSLSLGFFGGDGGGGGGGWEELAFGCRFVVETFLGFLFGMDTNYLVHSRIPHSKTRQI